ncbi:MAG: radical SAM protein, partial [Oscillospiraceae bacterium]|nr:radical SAM protein [Oscillospiraceae bacterium]
EIKSGFDAIDLDGFTEIVFCGYGEPTERAEVVAEIGEYINSRTDIPLRLNTNGLVKLINPEFDISRFRVFDCISISLNADNRVNYQKLTRSKFGEISFDSMLEFAEKMREFTKVFFTVVDTPDFKVDVKKCEKVSRECKVELRVRKFGM